MLFLSFSGNNFPSSFEATIKKVDKLLLHVLAHIYHSHFRQAVTMNLHGHLNTVTAHFMVFCKRFSLIDDREMDVLDDLYRKLTSVKVITTSSDSKTSLSSSSSTGDMETARGGSPVKSGVPATPPNSQSSTPEKTGVNKTGNNSMELTATTDLSDENKENHVVISSSLPQCHHQANGQARNSST